MVVKTFASSENIDRKNAETEIKSTRYHFPLYPYCRTAIFIVIVIIKAR